MDSRTPQLIRGAIIYESGFAVDADGCPAAYAPPGSGLRGLDDLSCAGHPGNWWGLVVDELGQPVIQGSGDPSPGYYVSMTALIDRTRRVRDPRRYVDAAKIPYISVAPELVARGVRMGDLGVAIVGGIVAGAVVADVGPHGRYGEGSIALAAALGLPSSPRSGGRSWGVTWLVWPGSHAAPPWPRPRADVEAEAARLFAQWGGLAAVPWMAPSV